MLWGETLPHTIFYPIPGTPSAFPINFIKLLIRKEEQNKIKYFYHGTNVEFPTSAYFDMNALK
jgi:hypothetical protein